MKNGYLLSAGILSLFTAFLHTIGGQIELVNPLLASDLTMQVRTEWLGAWHMITLILFVFAYYLIIAGRTAATQLNKELLRFIAILCFLFALSFIISSLYMQTLAPQWILFIPIGILVSLGIKR